MESDIKFIRRDIITSCYRGGGHIGGSLSIVEVLYVLYKHYLNNKRNDFILSKGHAVPALYAILKHFGIISKKEYQSYGSVGTNLIQHPSILVRGIEYSSGALGNGLSVGIGMALANRLDGKTIEKVFVLLGDGELNEGSVWEGLTYIASKRMTNIIALLDKNNLQASAQTKKFIKTDKLVKAIKALGWKIISVDGHNINAINQAIISTTGSSRPCFIVLNTIKGKGVSYMESNISWHHRRVTEEEYKGAIKELSEK